MQGVQQKLQQLHDDGICVFDAVLEPHQVDDLRRQLLHHLARSGRVYNGGNTQNDVVNVVEDIQWIFNQTLFADIVRSVVGEDAVYVHHSDALHNTYTGWHYDHIAHADSEQVLEFWSEHDGAPYQVYKFALYLQDHRHDKTALRYLRGSHARAKPYNLLERLYYYFFHQSVQPAPGSLVVFDQRLFHNGATPWLPTKLLHKVVKSQAWRQKLWNVERRLRGMQDRVFLQVAFGRPGEFSNQHAREMVDRQQRKKGEGEYVVSASLMRALEAGGIGLADVPGQRQAAEREPRLSE